MADIILVIFKVVNLIKFVFYLNNKNNYILLNRALECDQFGRMCDVISQWCKKNKSEVALVCPAVLKKQKKVSATLKVSL